MLKIGVTGGIGGGKSTVCKIFEVLGVPVYYADQGAKLLMNHDLAVIESIKKAFGNNIYNTKGELDRANLAHVVFNDKAKLKKLESIVHPAVREDFNKWALNHSAEYVIKEAALLFESGSYKDLDKIITVTAPEEVRVERVMKRENVSKEKVLNRMANQLAEQEKIDRADYVIHNDERQMLIPQVLEIHKALTNIA